MNEESTQRRRFIVEWLLVAVPLVALVAAIATWGWLQRADQVLYDTALRVWERPVPEKVVMVAVDDESIAELGRWPWRRSVHAALINRLGHAGAKAIGLDFILSEADADDPASDAALSSAMRRSGKVVLPIVQSAWSRGKFEELPPLAQFARAAAGLGHAHVELDSDGIARTVYLREGAARAPYPHFALATLAVADPRFRASVAGTPLSVATRSDEQDWVRQGPFNVPYAGPPGHVPQVSYAAVLRGAVPDSFFRDRIVLVGATAVGVADAYPTPVSGSSRAMSGVEINANVVAGLYEGIHLRPLPLIITAAASALACLLLLLALQRLPARSGLLVMVGASVGVLLLSLLLLRGAQVWFPPAATLAGCLMAYPLWGWRRLEAAQRFLDAELDRLSQEPVLLGDSIASPGVYADPLWRRIAGVRAAAAQSRELRRFISDALEGLPVGVLVGDHGGNVVLANRLALAALEVTDRRAIAGKPLAALLGKLQWNESGNVEETLAARGLGGMPSQLEVRTAGGAPFLISIAPFFATSGGLLGYLVSLSDIGELRAAQEGRDEAMRFLSHDLRAPLASIITLVEDAQRARGAEGDPFLNRVARHARNSLNLADDLLRLARAEAADPRRFAPLDLSAVLDEAEDDVWPLCRNRGIVIRRDSPSGAESLVTGDRELLRRAVINLLTNAARFSPAKGEIRLELSDIGNEWLIKVTDQGPGIPPERITEMFSRYSRYAPPGMSASEGVGLGLVIVKTIAQAHGGRIAVESEPGQGSSFRLHLPRASAAVNLNRR
ncbi:MAG: CHASE2 domain-containing protein [Betaproteobacteria bacterium]|nr:CHASE2 domain-containing protein [Betaproteobacteria bacterium]